MYYEEQYYIDNYKRIFYLQLEISIQSILKNIVLLIIAI
jgi:hypothetical protein